MFFNYRWRLLLFRVPKQRYRPTCDEAEDDGKSGVGYEQSQRDEASYSRSLCGSEDPEVRADYRDFRDPHREAVEDVANEDVLDALLARVSAAIAFRIPMSSWRLQGA